MNVVVQIRLIRKKTTLKGEKAKINHEKGKKRTMGKKKGDLWEGTIDRGRSQQKTEKKKKNCPGQGKKKFAQTGGGGQR